MCTVKSCLPMKRFLISRRNSIGKITTRMPKVVMRQKTELPRVQRSHRPLWVMILLGVSYSGATLIHFCTRIKMNGEIYRAMLNDVLPLLEETVIVDKDEWCFQQDSALAHKAKKKCKNGCQSTAQIFSNSDLNPLDYKLWSVLEECAGAWRYQNLGSPKVAREFPYS